MRFLSLLIMFVCPILALGQPPSPEQYDKKIKPVDREHWSFKPVTKPAVPEVNRREWVRNPIDAFVLAKLEAKKWSPSSAADSRTLMRRLYLNVIGLPPTTAEQEAFLSDQSSDKLDKLIDNLLSRSAYGEHWGRHWLDLARYAESNGYERDGLKPNVWRYRDYVINSFNKDKPFNRFVLEQIAGDEIPDASEESVIATGLHRLGPWDDEPADPETDRFDQLDDMVSTTSQVFLGLTMGCARCHDHKFEPLTMHDYYRFVAIFNPLKRPQDGRTDLDRPAVAGAKKEALRIRDQQIAILKKQNDHFRLIAGGFADTSSRSIAMLMARTPDPIRGYFMTEESASPPTTTILLRGVATRPGAKVEPGVPFVLNEKQPEFLTPGSSSTRRRLSLANWIIDPKHPLTARVIVNRVWQWNFGEGLVRTPSDFGKQGEKPTHPELLDWLADWFATDGNWSIKKLNRLILTSNTWRMNKKWNEKYGAEDPENRLLWRAPYHRLQVEAIRDSILMVSGKLNPEMGGPGAFLPIPAEALEGNSDPKTAWVASDEKAASRRTVYAVVKRALVVPLLETLDLCDTVRTASKRNVTTVPTQALTLFNGEFVNRQAEHLANRLERDVSQDIAKQIDYAYRLTLSRPASDREAAVLKDLYVKAGEGKKGLIQIARVIFNLNEFVYPD